MVCYGIHMVTKKAAREGATAVRDIAAAAGVKPSSLARAAHVTASPLMRQLRGKGALTVGEVGALAAQLGQRPSRVAGQVQR